MQLQSKENKSGDSNAWELDFFSLTESINYLVFTAAIHQPEIAWQICANLRSLGFPGSGLNYLSAGFLIRADSNFHVFYNNNNLSPRVCRIFLNHPEYFNTRNIALALVKFPSIVRLLDIPYLSEDEVDEIIIKRKIINYLKNNLDFNYSQIIKNLELIENKFQPLTCYKLKKIILYLLCKNFADIKSYNWRKIPSPDLIEFLSYILKKANDKITIGFVFEKLEHIWLSKLAKYGPQQLEQVFNNINIEFIDTGLIYLRRGVSPYIDPKDFANFFMAVPYQFHCHIAAQLNSLALDVKQTIIYILTYLDINYCNHLLLSLLKCNKLQNFIPNVETAKAVMAALPEKALDIDIWFEGGLVKQIDNLTKNTKAPPTLPDKTLILYYLRLYDDYKNDTGMRFFDQTKRLFQKLQKDIIHAKSYYDWFVIMISLHNIKITDENKLSFLYSVGNLIRDALMNHELWTEELTYLDNQKNYNSEQYKMDCEQIKIMQFGIGRFEQAKDIFDRVLAAKVGHSFEDFVKIVEQSQQPTYCCLL